MAINYNPKIVTDGLMVALDAKNVKSYPGTGTSWKNLAGGVNSTLTTPPTYNSSGWFEFDGTTQVVDLGYPAKTTFTTDSEFTIECWVNFSAYKPAADSIGTIVGAFDYQGYGLHWRGAPTIIYVHAYMRYASVTSQTPGYTITPGLWYHAVQSYSRLNNYNRLYINGTLFSSNVSISGSYNANLDGQNISIGYGTNSDGTPGGTTAGTGLLGKVAQTRIYTRSLSSAEILQNFNASRGRYGL